MPGRFENLSFEEPFVVHDGELRSLHFTLGEVQSSMRADRPDELQIGYTRTMMGFLLLQPQPRNITLIGLGGGSLVKFCRRYMPSARITAVENNPAVIALRKEFAIPDDDDRLSIVADDGAAFMRRSAGSIDVLLVDAFGRDGLPPTLATQAFYDDCHRSLAPGGVLAMNLHADDVGHDLVTQRLAASFQGNAMQVVAPGRCNCIVFAARGTPVSLEALRGTQWSRALPIEAARQLKEAMVHIGWNACGLGT
jgi:spermidine synthase